MTLRHHAFVLLRILKKINNVGWFPHILYLFFHLRHTRICIVLLQLCSAMFSAATLMLERRSHKNRGCLVEPERCMGQGCRHAELWHFCLTSTVKRWMVDTLRALDMHLGHPLVL